MALKRYVVLNKKVGETPLSCMEEWRVQQPPEYREVPLTYAGRLDPMASGKLLVLIGEECKAQQKYHALDKEYVFSVLFGVATDTADVLGILTTVEAAAPPHASLQTVAQMLTGPLPLPYPHFSAKTVAGKPLHQWTLEGRLDEIEVPRQEAYIYRLSLLEVETKTGEEIHQEVRAKIAAVAPVTDERKALGNDFRREPITAAWTAFAAAHSEEVFTIATFRCTARSGTYMRSLAEEIARRLGTVGLAYHIDRTVIGRFKPLPFSFGWWSQRFR